MNPIFSVKVLPNVSICPENQPHFFSQAIVHYLKHKIANIKPV